MSNRITQKDLENRVRTINELTGSPIEPSTRENGVYKSNPNNYHLSYAYGGVTLYRMSNEGGGVNTPLSCGYVTKRELYGLLGSFINGINTKGN